MRDIENIFEYTIIDPYLIKYEIFGTIKGNFILIEVKGFTPCKNSKKKKTSS